MSEIRKPSLTILLRKQGKTDANKLEIFPAEQWNPTYKNEYRLRVNGKWYSWEGKRYFYKTQIMKLLAKSLPL